MRSSKEFPLSQKGIYRNLPTFDPSITGLIALVTGGTGISGFNTIRCLLESPDRWHKVYTLSRKPPSEKLLSLLEPSQRERLFHVSVDLLSSAEDIAETFKLEKIAATHVFFYAYIQPTANEDVGIWENVQELVRINGQLFSNFLSALSLSNIKPERIMLQTGGKNYGVQNGLCRLPCVESDPRVVHLGPNFYYPQEDALFSFCKAHPETKWNVIRPFAIYGTSESAQMNSLFLLGAYAAVQSENQDALQFPGGWETWETPTPTSTARLTGYLTEWAVLEDGCANEAFNAEDGNVMSWDRFFHELCRWYGVERGVSGPNNESKLAPFVMKGGEKSPLGCGPDVHVGTSFDLVEWAQKPSTIAAWESLMKKSPNMIPHNPFQENIHDLLGLAKYLFSISCTVSMNKARILGWSGFVDTLESAFEVLSEMAKLGILPPLKAEKPRPLV